MLCVTMLWAHARGAMSVVPGTEVWERAKSAPNMLAGRWTEGQGRPTKLSQASKPRACPGGGVEGPGAAR